MCCVATGADGTGLLASGIGFTTGLVLEAITGAASMVDEKTKKELIRRGREQARASFIKKSPLQNLRLPELCVFQRLRVLTPTDHRARSVAYNFNLSVPNQSKTNAYSLGRHNTPATIQQHALLQFYCRRSPGK